MTSDDFWQEATTIGNRYLGKPSTEVTRFQFKSEIDQLVERFYAVGGVLIDRCGPIEYSDLRMVVDSDGPYKISCFPTRRSNFLEVADV